MILALAIATQAVEDQILLSIQRKVQALKPLLTLVGSHKRSMLKSHENLPWSL